MLTLTEMSLIYICVEWFLYGTIFVLCALICNLAEEVHYSLIKDSIPEYSPYIYNAQRKTPDRQ